MRCFIAARHQIADEAIAADVAAGTRQVVVLGSGLDTLAHRNPLPGTLRIVEVDHPVTQEWKRATVRAAGLPALDSQAYLPVDFETDDLGGRLRDGGVDLGAPVVFVWLGVVPYLTRAAVDQTLALVSTVPGATLVFDYANPPDQLPEGSRAAHTRRAQRVSALGEPWLTYFDTEELATHLRTFGMSVHADTDPSDIAERWFAVPPHEPRRRGGHVVVATT